MDKENKTEVATIDLKEKPLYRYEYMRFNPKVKRSNKRQCKFCIHFKDGSLSGAGVCDKKKCSTLPNKRRSCKSFLLDKSKQVEYELHRIKCSDPEQSKYVPVIQKQTAAFYEEEFRKIELHRKKKSNDQNSSH